MFSQETPTILLSNRLKYLISPYYSAGSGTKRNTPHTQTVNREPNQVLKCVKIRVERNHMRILWNRLTRTVETNNGTNQVFHCHKIVDPVFCSLDVPLSIQMHFGRLFPHTHFQIELFEQRRGTHSLTLTLSLFPLTEYSLDFFHRQNGGIKFSQIPILAIGNSFNSHFKHSNWENTASQLTTHHLGGFRNTAFVPVNLLLGARL